MSKLKMIDLCAGTGAFTKAFEETGKVTTVFANDIEKTSQQIYNNNFKHNLVCCDIHDIIVSDIPKHDILCSGFPCQPFSLAGKKKGYQLVALKLIFLYSFSLKNLMRNY